MRFNSFRPLFLCILSAVLLVFSFPKIDCGPLIWFSLIPWFFAIDGKRMPAAFGYSFLTGFIFFYGSLYWFMYVTVPGAFLLMMYLALYFAVFGCAYRFFSDRRLWFRITALASVWVALEFARGHLLSGFGWVSLGHSQYRNGALVQIADITGVYGVSFLVVAVNLLIKENLVFGWGHSNEKKDGLLRVNVIVLLALIAVFVYGFFRLSRPYGGDILRVGVVQGNVPQDEKWIFERRGMIIEKYLHLSRQALKEKPDLIVWPETAFPGLAAETPELMERIKVFARVARVPVLLGIVSEENSLYYNSAALISPDGEQVNRYDKLHLVPFGEYLPLRKEFPFLADIVPIEDFSPGKKATVFDLPTPSPRGLFSVVICFEDTLAHIARRFADQGAQFLINITNDAWFEDSKAPFMHLQAAVFRSIETRRSMVRAANTGVSCAIDPYGRATQYLQDENGKKTYIDGAAVFPVTLNTERTLYTKLGDVFTYLCFLCILWAYFDTKRHRP